MPDDMKNRSRVNLFEAETDDCAFSSLNDWCMIRSGTIKLTLKLEDNSPIFLFDLVSDPYEENNLIASDFEKEVIQQLAAKLISWKENCIAYHDKNFA